MSNRPTSATLREHLDEIIADIERGKVQSKYREPLIDHLERTVSASEGRSESGLARSRERSIRIREAVSKAAIQINVERQGLSGRDRSWLIRQRAHAILNASLPEGKKPYAKPSRRIVADVLRDEKRIATFGTETTRAPRYAEFTATCCST